MISIDETDIRSDKTSRYAWQFVANERPFMRALVNEMEDKHELPHEHNIESELGEISSEVSQISV